MKTFHNQEIKKVYKYTNSSAKGLTSSEAAERLAQNRPNALKGTKEPGIIKRFFMQMKDLMIIVLLAAAVISGIIAIIDKDYTGLVDSAIILFIVILNSVIGTIQEYKADKSMKALANMNKPFTKVIRDGETIKIRSEDVVVGDIVVLEAGDVVPADIRLIESHSLKIQESALTGESVPVEKDCNELVDADAPLGDRKNMAFSSGVVMFGRARGVVVATGMNTEVGKIATMLTTEKETETPLQRELNRVAKVLAIVILIATGIIFVAGLLTASSEMSWSDRIIDNFMIAVAIAVAAIPEGLTAVVTIVLSIGVKHMSERKAIVKHLPSVETLGGCEVICSDKTGTLTVNRMTVKQLYCLSAGMFDKLPSKDKTSKMLIEGLVLCNDAEQNADNELIGDPTETALITYAKNQGVCFKELRANNPRVYELPFDSNRKLMTTVHPLGEGNISYTKGAVDMLLKRCVKILDGGKERKITDNDLETIASYNTKMCSKGLRVLAVAYKALKDNNFDKVEQELVFIGLVGMIDPPREEVPKAVETCKRAGMTPIMITGDHIDTAIAIAKEIGIFSKGDKAITGAELDKMNDKQFIKQLRKIKVFARVSPENKMRIVQAYKSLNVIVAMTGDGVNDAPSIKVADIGIGMGITGTEVSKGAADIILADDNFATIIAAVEEGRKVYSNIKKTVQYLLSANIAEVLCLFIATIFLRVQFLTPIMILWVNLITDSLPALALGVERAENDVMKQPPRKSGQSLFAQSTGLNIVIQGVFQTLLTLLSFILGYYVLGDTTIAMSMAFVTLSAIQLLHAYNCRSQVHSIFSSNPFSNKAMNGAMLIGILLTIVVFIPGISGIFGIATLNMTQLLISIGMAVLIIPIVEIQKCVVRLLQKRKQ